MLLAVLLCCLAAAMGPPPAAASPPALDCDAAAVMDRTTGRFLYLWHADRRLPMASTTKIMTAKAALDSGVDLEQVVRIGVLDLRWDESSVGLKEGQRLRVEQLLQALLVASANDAARALAVAVDGSEAAFVERMNRTARLLDLSDTHFANAHGMDAPGHYTTARDLTRLAAVALADERFAQYVALTSVRLPKADGGMLRVRTTDSFLRANRSWVYGVKTGYTDKAESCLVSAGCYEGEHIIVTVLGSPDPQTRDRMALRLYQYGRSLYRTWSSPRAGSPLVRLAVPYARTPLKLTLGEAFSVELPPGAAVTKTVTAPPVATLPVASAAALGEVAYAVDGQQRGRRVLLAERAIPVASWETRLRYRLWDTWSGGDEREGLLQRTWHKAGEVFRDIGGWFGRLF